MKSWKTSTRAHSGTWCCVGTLAKGAPRLRLKFKTVQKCATIKVRYGCSLLPTLPRLHHPPYSLVAISLPRRITNCKYCAIAYTSHELYFQTKMPLVIHTDFKIEIDILSTVCSRPERPNSIVNMIEYFLHSGRWCIAFENLGPSLCVAY